jgi:hypothetical protein
MIIILVAIVGLAVDVGNTYAEQRELVAATNASAIVGMQVLLADSAATVGEIRHAIEQSLRDNGIVLEDGSLEERNIVASFLGADGTLISEIPPNPDNDPQRNSSPVPADVAYIEVRSDGNVDTFFARLVGTDDLPVNHQSYAGICPPSSGVYPIAVDGKLFTSDGNAFLEPDGVQDQDDPEWGIIAQQRDNSWSGKTWRRMYLKDAGTAGGFSWLRWSDDKDPNGYAGTSANALAASLTGDGNLALNFDEAPLPGLALVPPDDPDTYPKQPAQINATDWIWQGPGKTMSNEVIDAIEGHKQRRTVMTLPIYDYNTAGEQGGSNGKFRVARLANFAIKDYGFQGQGNQSYIELVYLGSETTATACTVTAVQPALLGLTGAVEFWPEYQSEMEERLPVQYFVVLDASGSMNFSFDGWGWDPDEDDRKACAVELDGTVIDGKTYSASGCSGSGDGWSGGNAYYAWHPVKERRAYVAKKALERLIDLGNFEGSTNEDTSMPHDEMQIIWFSSVQNRNWESDRSSDAEYLRQSLLMAGIHPGGNYIDKYNDLDAINGVPNDATEPNGEGLIEAYYTSNGGTNGAAGLYRASIRMAEAPERVTFDGETKDYKRAVILVTDGVSNQFLDMNDDEELHLDNNRTPDRFADPSYCRSLSSDIERHNSAICQTTSGATGPNETGENAGKWCTNGTCYDRPITQMGNVSEEYLRPNAEVYVIALSDFATTGLKERVASFPEYFIPARSLEWFDTDGDGEDDTTNVDQIVEFIQANVGQGECVANAENRWVGSMSRAEADARFYTWPAVGYVDLYQNNQLIETADIVLDQATGVLRYTFNNNLPPGSYELRAEIIYVHPEDGTPRVYSDIVSVGETVNPSIGVTLEPTAQVGGSMIEFDLQLKLPDDDFVCPGLLDS